MDEFKELAQSVCKTVEDYCKSSSCGSESFDAGYNCGMLEMLKVSVNALQEVVDTFYNSKFDPCIDYLKIYSESIKRQLITEE